jgi:hypothetical protein
MKQPLFFFNDSNYELTSGLIFRKGERGATKLERISAGDDFFGGKLDRAKFILDAIAN